MRKVVSSVACALLLALSSNSPALATASTTKPALVLSPTFSEQLVLSGIVRKLERGTALFTADRCYPLIGGDFNMIVGEKVNIIGKLVKENNIDKLEVARVQFERK